MSSLRFRYQTIEFGDSDIHVRTLRDRQQFSDSGSIEAEKLGVSPASWPLFGVIWDSSQILAQLMFEYDIKGKRILEVGCGIALSSLMLNQRHADITATDYNPEAGVFLAKNVTLNDGDLIPFVQADWHDENSALGEFDLIIGSDLLYEPDHAELLSSFIDRHAKADAQVIMIDPGRGNHPRFSKHMVKLGYTHTQAKPTIESEQSKTFRGQVLRYAKDV
jgi:predicted nicotinamide N-methyase